MQQYEKTTALSFPRRRESSLSYKFRVADNAMLGVVPLRGVCCMCWIPACAGMTATAKVSVINEKINNL
jgi:hypothetical protein